MVNVVECQVIRGYPSSFMYFFCVGRKYSPQPYHYQWHIHIQALHFHWLYHAVYVCLLLFDMPFLFQSLHYSLLKLLTGRVLVLSPAPVVVLRKTVPWYHHLFLPLGRGYYLVLYYDIFLLKYLTNSFVYWFKPHYILGYFLLDYKSCSQISCLVSFTAVIEVIFVFCNLAFSCLGGVISWRIYFVKHY